MEPLNQEQNNNQSVEQNSQNPQFQQPEKTNKFGKHFVFLFTLLIISLTGAGLVFAINLVSEEIEKQEVEVSVSDPYASWKIYRNEEYGFEISHPNDFVVKNVGEEIHLVIPIEKYFRTQLANEARIELHSPKKSCSESSSLGDSHSEDQDFISAGDIKFAKHRWSDVGAGQFYAGNTYRTNNEGECYEIVLFTHSAGSAGFFIDDQNEIKRFDALHAEDMENIFKSADKIAATFKFSDKTAIDTSSWKTYRNEEYGFEFKYPVNWEFESIVRNEVDTWRNYEILSLTFSELGSKRMVVNLYPSEYTNMGASEGAFVDGYYRHSYFFGEKIQETVISGYKTIVNYHGCYECYEFSEEELDYYRKQIVSITCNTKDVCMRMNLVDLGVDGGDEKDFFINSMLPTLKFNNSFENVKYKFRKSSG